MSYNVYLTDTFSKCLKTLKKKYRRVKDDLLEVIRQLEADPTIGDPIPGWRRDVWKVRVASSDIKRGKSGGFRVIYLWKEQEQDIYLLSMYSKSAKQDMTVKEIRNLLYQTELNLEDDKSV